MSRYIQLGSLGDLLDTGVSIAAANYFLEEWRRNMRAGLNCLLSAEEGGILADTINMYYNVAVTRLDFTRTKYDRLNYEFIYDHVLFALFKNVLYY